MTTSIQTLCIEKNITIATAESCTGGNIARQITSLSGSSAYYLGGVVSYANSVKTGVLQVKKAELDSHGAVSEIVAKQMIQGVVSTLDADFGVSTTGIAGPGGGSKEKPVGTVWIGVGNSRTQEATKYLFQGTREEVIAQSTQQALKDLFNFVNKYV